MALTKCPECNHEISDMAPTCPNCGCPINKQKRISRLKNIFNRKNLKYILGAVIVVVLAAVLAVSISMRPKPDDTYILDTVTGKYIYLDQSRKDVEKIYGEPEPKYSEPFDDVPGGFCACYNPDENSVIYIDYYNDKVATIHIGDFNKNKSRFQTLHDINNGNSQNNSQSEYGTEYKYEFEKNNQTYIIEKDKSMIDIYSEDMYKLFYE